MKKIIFILFVLFLAGCSNGNINSIKLEDVISKENYLSLDKNYFIAVQVIGDVTGDKLDDDIYLIGYQENKEKEDFISQNYYTNLYLLIVNGADGSLQKVLPKYTEGLSPSLIAEDFNSDGVRDIYISMSTLPGGGADRKLVNIISYKDNREITLFDDLTVGEGLGFDISLKDDYFVEVLCKEFDKTISFKLEKSICEWLEEENIYKDGRVIKQAAMTVDRFSELNLVDIDNDGVYELEGSQYLALMSHTAGLGFVKTTLSYDVNKKEWNVDELDFKTTW